MSQMNKKVLLVDDVHMFIEIQKEFLHYSNVTVLTARNGMEALDVVRTMKPDLVFMDLEMPLMDGAECCRVIKSDRAFAEIPVIIISSTGTEEARSKCFAAGCSHYLPKPLGRDTFLNVARSFITGIDRRERRHKCDIEAVFSLHDATVSCRMYDLSAGGTYIISDYDVVPRDVIQIHFTMPDGTKIECPGRVAWVNNSYEKFHRGFGAKFSMLSKDAHDALARFSEAAMQANLKKK
jgi:CheY-like chemotaxis protein